MTDRPIIFSAPMVRALLDRRKTMTRRPAALPPKKIGGRLMTGCVSPWQRVQPGDRLWVREAWSSLPRTAYHLPKTVDPSDADMAAYYRADFDRSGKPIWRPSIHMPRWASRLTLIVTATKIERLQEISAKDCLAEGIPPITEQSYWNQPIPAEPNLPAIYRGAFACLWAEIHGRGSWAANPEVVALTFRVIHANIDSAEARAA